MASTPHPMAAAFEKAVADKMNMRNGKKQSGATPFHGHGGALPGVGQSARGFKLHPKNKTRVSPKRGMSSNGPVA